MRILLVEDHHELAQLIGRALAGASFVVENARDGETADTLLRTRQYALAILDLSLPKLDGMEVLRRMRARADKTPVMIVTARGGLAERVQGLNSGADDYLAKPFELAELEARVKALLRRAQGNEALTLTCGTLSFDTVSRMFAVAGAPLALTPREQGVLEPLIARAGKAVAKDKLFNAVFTLDDDVNPDAIEIYIHRLRKKLQGADVAIVTLRGLGYLLEARPADANAERVVQ